MVLGKSGATLLPRLVRKGSVIRAGRVLTPGNGPL